MTGTTPSVNRKSRLLVVEDHKVVRDGFVALINREADLEVCGEADSATAALACIGKNNPDLVVVDLTLREGNGLDLIKSSKALYPETPFLVISMQEEDLYAERCIKAGASGYIMKSSATEEFLDAIRTILCGEVYVSRKMNIRLLKKFASNHIADGKTELSNLSDRELQIYEMIGAGMNTRDIAPKLGISPKTVAAHRENIKTKLGVKDGRALLQSAMAWLKQKSES
ncbi:MAG TPA: response regulator transcription factor [Kiritimatiellia bacterium]|nr:response regulator transcription factor [Kiritimatiellia bacterium]